MESGRGHGGVMRGGPGGKKMRKRKELDALVGGVGAKRANGGGVKRGGSGGVSPQDQLLSESTGEEDYWSSAKGGSAPKRKIHYNPPAGKSRVRACTALLRLCTILLVMACVVATITVMWLFIDIKEQTTYLRSQLDKVTAGNEAIPDAIQKCHSLTKQLEKNQSYIIIQLQQVGQRLTNFSNMISEIQAGLSMVEKQLNDTPQLISIPKTLQPLMDSVANFGGQLTDFNTTTMKVSNEQRKISEQIENINKNLSLYYTLQEELQDWKNHSSGKTEESSQRNSEVILQSVLDRITPNISSLNSTLWSQVDWVIEDQRSSQKVINELKDKYEDCNSRIKTVNEEQVQQRKALNDMKAETAQLHIDIAHCKDDADQSRELLKNLTLQVSSCTCLGDNSSRDPSLTPLRV